MIYLITVDPNIINRSRETDAIFAMATLENMFDYFKDAPIIATDTETRTFLPFDHKGELLAIQFGDADNQFIIDYKNFADEEVDLLRDWTKPKQFIFHNFKFDYKWMYSIGIDIHRVYDTYLGEAIITTGYGDKERHLGLKDCADKYCSARLHKEDRGKIVYEGFTDKVIEYCANDVKYLHSIREQQIVKLNEMYPNAFNGSYNIPELEMEFVRTIAIMEYEGIYVDSKKWLAVADITEKNMSDGCANLNRIFEESYRKSSIPVQARLQKYIHIPTQYDLFEELKGATVKINWGSPTQKLDILQAFGLRLHDTENKHLIKVREKHPIVPVLIQYNKSKKMVESFGRDFIQKFVHPVTNNLHPDFFQIVSTGRISCRKPNLLNIPAHGELGKMIRAAFVARPGYKMVGGDFSNFELRIIAEFSLDPLWLKTFDDDGDLHAVLCVRTHKIDESLIKTPFPLKPEFTYREVQKTLDFGLAYGMSKFKLSELLDISLVKAQALIDEFFAIIPDVKKFLDALECIAQTKGYIKTAKPYARIRWFKDFAEADDYRRGEIGRAGKNSPIQGINGDVIKLSLNRARHVIDDKKYPVHLRLSIYDEILTECAEDFAEEWKPILENIMIDSAKVVLKRVPVKVDVKISDCWTK